MFLQGACGNLSASRGGRSTDEYGIALAREALELRASVAPESPSSPSIASATEEFTFSSRVDLTEPLTYLAYCIAFFKDLVDAYIAEYEAGIRPSITVTVLNGEIGLVGASGEFFCSHGLRLKRESKLPHTLFLGYCNGYHQYFPTRAAIEQGGYGADKEVSPVEPGAGEKMIDAALEWLESLGG